MSFTRQQVADACRKHCVDVKLELISNYDPAQLLWAITGNESSFGLNCKPRYEPGYDLGGRYGASPDQVALRLKFGKDAAYSYGPGQVMLVNCPKGYSPIYFSDLDNGISAEVYALNTLLERNKPKTLLEIGACYNHGSIPKSPWPEVVTKYAQRLLDNYAEPMPDEVLKG